MKESTLIHIPHASVFIPEKYRPECGMGRLRHELDVMTDWYCDELFDCGRERLVFPVSRLVCDPERFREDRMEVMAKIGMGTVYTRCSDLSPLRRENAEQKQEILERYYDPHHNQFEDIVEKMLKIHGHCLILDGHSFHPSPLPYELCQDPNRPDFCIGTSDFHTPDRLVHRLKALLEGEGFTVSVNAPFWGTIVPMKFYRKDRRVKSVMIEINRRLYMDRPGIKNSDFGKIRKILGRCVDSLESETE